MPVLGLRCCMGAPLAVVCRLLSVVAFLVQGTSSRAHGPVVAACGLSSCGSWALEYRQAQQLWCMGLVALQRVGSSWIRDQTRVSCFDKQVLYH